MKLEGKILDREFKPIRKQVNRCFEKSSEETRLEQCRRKEMQSEKYNKQNKKSDIWLVQNLTPRKTSAIMSMVEQIVETRAWKDVRGFAENSQCRLRKEQ